MIRKFLDSLTSKPNIKTKNDSIKTGDELADRILGDISFINFCYIIKATVKSFSSGLFEVSEAGTEYKNETVEIFKKYSDEIQDKYKDQGLIVISSLNNEAPQIKVIKHYNPELFDTDLFNLVLFQEFNLKPIKEQLKEKLTQSILKEKIKETLVFACYENNADKISASLAKITKSQLNNKLDYVGTPLGLTAEHNNIEAFIAIARAGADIGKKSLTETPLSIAFQESPKIVKFIYEEYPEQFKKELSQKGFGIALRTKDVELLKLILNSGADINCKGEPFPPLHNFADNNNVVGLKFLVENGVDVNVKNQYKQTALDRAISMGNQEAIDYLNSVEK